MAPERDLFANFARMRREMDELLGERPGPAAPRRGGFVPAVDVYYLDGPPRAVLQADLAGVDPAGVTLVVRGREIVLSGHRALGPREERVYQQLEIPHGAFRRVVALGAEVDADAAHASYENGMLVVELPLVPAPRTVVRVGAPPVP